MRAMFRPPVPGDGHYNVHMHEPSLPMFSKQLAVWVWAEEK